MRMTDGHHQHIGQPHRPPGWSRPGQTGAATLAVAVIMLLVVSVLVFHSHTAGWLEQRATANQARAKQAHAAAEAGLEAALSVLNADTGNPSRGTHLVAASLTTSPACIGVLDPVGKFCIISSTLNGSFGVGSAYSVTLGLVTGDAAPAKRFRLTSNGGSDCSELANLNTCSGRAAVGQVVELAPILRIPPTVAITSPANFSNLFGAPLAAIKALTTPVLPSTPFTFSSTTSGLVWYEGDLALTGDVGSDASPVLLVVEGNLTISAGADIRGFVFVTGTASCVTCPSGRVSGAIAAAATNGLTTTEVVLPTDAINGPLARVGSTAIRFAKVMGTWRDW